MVEIWRSVAHRADTSWSNYYRAPRARVGNNGWSAFQKGASPVNTGRVHGAMTPSDPSGIRTRVAAVKGPCPGPLDDGASYVRRRNCPGREESTGFGGGSQLPVNPMRPREPAKTQIPKPESRNPESNPKSNDQTKAARERSGSFFIAALVIGS